MGLKSHLKSHRCTPERRRGGDGGRGEDREMKGVRREVGKE